MLSSPSSTFAFAFAFTFAFTFAWLLLCFRCGRPTYRIYAAILTVLHCTVLYHTPLSTGACTSPTPTSTQHNTIPVATDHRTVFRSQPAPKGERLTGRVIWVMGGGCAVGDSGRWQRNACKCLSSAHVHYALALAFPRSFLACGPCLPACLPCLALPGWAGWLATTPAPSLCSLTLTRPQGR